jgi:hypothetical protein
MNDSGFITPPSTSHEYDRSRRQLENVFRVLAKPDHQLREKALKLRQEVSSAWQILAARDEWFAWPATTAPRGTRGLKRCEWRPYGMLSFLGYHVGETQPTSQEIRWHILEYAFECHLPPLHDPLYYSEWGRPKTPQRLSKMANTLAALTRNAKRRDTVSFRRAIDDWEHDLVLLRDKYYVDFFHFGWPETRPFLH